MGLGEWFKTDGFILLQSLGIIGGLLFTAFTVRAESASRRVTNLIRLTEQHRTIWREIYDRPPLRRVLRTDVDLATAPVTGDEGLFVRFLILHLASSYRAMQEDTFTSPEALRVDVRRFFRLPIPAAVWVELKSLQDQDFVAFVEACLETQGGDS